MDVAVALARRDGGEVGVEYPRHDLGVGVDVRGGHVVLGPDGVAECVGEATRDLLDFARRVLERIELDAALGAAQRETDDGALPGHPCRERAHFLDIDVGVEAEAALERAEDVVVLDAVAGEHFHTAIIELDREVDDDLVGGFGENAPDRRIQRHHVGCFIELLLDVIVDAAPLRGLADCRR